jgi:hypothetical protein
MDANCSQQVSTLHKQNFDLKLELFHRRQRQEALEARLEAAEKQITEQGELQEVNEQLLAELEKRDQAVEEAVGIIVNLEDKVERLMRERETVRTFDAQYESTYFRPSQEDGPPSSPPEFAEETKPSRPILTSKSIARMPSFLSEQSEGTEALRSLYLPNNHSYSDATLPKLLEEASATDGMNSPRLSVLSESSFLSVYGEKPLSLDANNGQEEVEDGSRRRHRKSSSVEKWIDERPAPDATPSRPTPGTGLGGLRKNQYLSINDVLESPLQRLEKLKHTLEKHNSSLVSQRPPNQPERAMSIQDKRKSREVLRRVFTDKASFEHHHALPPTPDTISTSTLRHYKNSNDTIGKDANERTFLSSTSTFPVPDATENAFQSTLSIRPRSAGETVTSRREGHGWDTETQDDFADDASSTASTYSAQQYRRPKRIQTPNLFMFGNDQEDEREWGRDMMFNNDSAARLPHHNRTAHRYDALRRSSMVEHPRSDDTVVPTSNFKSFSRYNGDSVMQHGTSPIDLSQKPDLPDRRSSLSATAKMRKLPAVNNASPSNATAGSPVSSKDNKDLGKKSRLHPIRLFGRSETSPALNGSFPQQSSRPKGAIGRSQSYFSSQDDNFDNREYATATPPPIKRSRIPQGYRPSSAGDGLPSGGSKRMTTAFGYDGVVEAEVGRARRGSIDIEPRGVDDSAKTGVSGAKKWFGRAGSLRRN